MQPRRSYVGPWWLPLALAILLVVALSWPLAAWLPLPLAATVNFLLGAVAGGVGGWLSERRRSRRGWK